MNSLNRDANFFAASNDKTGASIAPTCEFVALGCSLGGLTALETILPTLPHDWALPLVIVQHRSVESGDALLRTLRRYSALPVREPQDKEPVLPGFVYIAPANYHLLVEETEAGETGARPARAGIGKQAGCYAFALSTDVPVLYARPSINVLFDSVAEAYGARAVGVVLTGASEDGATGAANIKTCGGRVLAQDPDEAESSLMPRAAIRVAAPDAVLPLAAIGNYLARLRGAGQ